jgi:Carboxypeptidase regulatory-like domain/TonB dependent receptor
MSKNLLTVITLGLILLFCSSTTVLGQAVYGSIVGTVADPSGAIVPNATVTITNVNQGVNFSTLTNASGNYAQTHLIVGTYRVRVDATGFQASVHENVQVNVDAATQVNAQLMIAGLSQNVLVTDEASLLKTTKTDVSDTIPQKSLVNLPILDRNVARLIYLAPGVSGTGTGASSEQPQDIFRPKVGGQAWGGVSAQLDGTDNRESVLGAMVISPNIDALSELKFTTGSYDAEFGQANQGIIVAQIKSGTNQIHGSAFWYHRDNSTFARNPFTQSQPLVGSTNRFIPATRWNQFGGSVGGPIQKNKTFFFGDYQGSRQRDGGSVQARVPTDAERTGDLRGLGVNIYDPCDATLTNCNVAPALRTQFMGNDGKTPNVIPTSRLSPQALYLLNKFIPRVGGDGPCVPLAGATGAQNNVVCSGVGTVTSDAFDVRIDRYQTQKINMFGRYSLQQFKQYAPGAFGDDAGGPTFSNFAGKSDSRNQSLAVGVNVTLRPTLVADFRFGLFRARVLVNPNGLGTSPAKDAGIPGLNLDNNYTSGMPGFALMGTGGFTFGYSLNHNINGFAITNNNCNCPLNEQQTQFQWVTNWTYVRGDHSFKFGIDVRHHRNLRVPSDNHRAGELQFSTANTGTGTSGGTGGLSLATYLLGNVSAFGRYVSNITDATESQNRLFSYAQDTWRVNSKLTVNYGLRWEIYFPQYVNGKDKGGFIDPSSAEVLVAGENGVSLNGNIKTNLKYIAPRLGIAYQVTPRTVIRMGYGRSFDVGVFGTSFGHNVTQNLPVLANQAITPASPFLSVFTLAQGPPSVSPAALLGAQPLGPGGNHLLPTPGNPAPGVPPGVSSVVPNLLPLNSDRTMRLPTVDSWNITLEHQFGSSLVASVAYVGNKGTHVFPENQSPDLNQASLVGFPTVPTNRRGRLFALYGWTQGTKYYGDDANNHFNSLQARAEKRFSSGLSFQTIYTWASAYDYTNDYFYWDPAVDYGFTDGQRKHIFTAINLYELPFGKGRKFLSHAPRAVDLVLGGWQFSGNWVWETGLPFTPSYQNCGSDRDTGPCKPNIVGDVQTGLSRNAWYTVASTVLTNPARSTATPCPSTPGITSGPWQEPACATFGSVPRNALFGPNLFNADLAFAKSFTITERLKAQVRAETFNAFNHVNLGQPNASVDSSTAGRITGLAAGTTMRRWQFALRLEF